MGLLERHMKWSLWWSTVIVRRVGRASMGVWQEVDIYIGMR